MPLGDIYQLGVNQVIHGVQIANVYHFEQTVDTTPGTRAEDSLMEAWKEKMIPLQAAMSVTQWQMSCMTARKVRVTPGAQFVLPDTTPGTVIGEGNAASTCCLASLYSSNVGPRGRGRKFISGLPISSNDKGRLDLAALTTFTAFLDELITAIKWTADNAQFIIRIISTIDAVIRNVQSYHMRRALTKQSSRLPHIC